MNNHEPHDMQYIKEDYTKLDALIKLDKTLVNLTTVLVDELGMITTVLQDYLGMIRIEIESVNKTLIEIQQRQELNSY